jgi:hypothetical protein
MKNEASLILIVFEVSILVVELAEKVTSIRSSVEERMAKVV